MSALGRTARVGTPAGTLTVALLVGVVGCGAGEGGGTVDTKQPPDRLYVQNCWEGPFHLGPTFFASDPFADTQQIRIQRGDRMISVSDGVLLVVNDVSKLRATQLGTKIRLGLPVGVRPPGFPINVDANPPQVSLTLYLYDTCHLQNGALYSVDGFIQFNSLFSGDRNEDNADDRLTDATFEATVTDPRDATLAPAGANGGAADGGAADAGVPAPGAALEPRYVAAHTSVITGSFHFFFQRGVPAQPFP